MDEMMRRDVAEALMDSHYLAGLKMGWNLGLFEDQERYAAIVRNHAGYLAPILQQRASQGGGGEP